MDNVIVLPGSKQLGTAPDEKTLDIHVFITITRSISLLVDYKSLRLSSSQ
jgi:hypothetical protein